MDAWDRRAARSGPGSARRVIGVLGTATILVATLAWGCGTQPVPSVHPGPVDDAGGNCHARPDAQPHARLRRHAAGRLGLRVVHRLGGFRSATEGGCCTGMAPKQIDVGSVVYSRLYRQDARYGAVPDLTDGPCLPQADPKVIRCRIIETTFQDGTPLAADDVAYSFRLFGRDAFSGGPREELVRQPQGSAGRRPADGRLRALVR